MAEIIIDSPIKRAANAQARRKADVESAVSLQTMLNRTPAEIDAYIDSFNGLAEVKVALSELYRLVAMMSKGKQ